LMLVTLVAFALLPCCLASAKVTVISENKAWLENLVMEPSSDNLFMSELKFGRVWRVHGFSNGTYSESMWLSGFTSTLGLTRDISKIGILYGVGMKNNTNVVFRFSDEVPNNFTIIANLPKDRLGNGFGCHYATGKLYTSSEGNFEPGTGSVYEIDPATGAVVTLTTKMWAADGLWIDQDRHLLYVGQLFSATVFVWNLTGTPEFIGELSGFGGFLDDFTLAKDGTVIAGCDWSGNKIIQFNAVPTNGTVSPVVVVGDGVVHPTSARWGLGPAGDPFAATSLFVTEGRARDYLDKSRHDRLLRIDFD